MRKARTIELDSKQRSELERMVRSQIIGVRAVRRAQIVLLAADEREQDFRGSRGG
jgi:hypothetical protein